MARRRKAMAEDETSCLGCLVSLGGITMLLSFALAAIQTPGFWIGVAILAVIGAIHIYYEHLWVEFYIDSEDSRLPSKRLKIF